MNVSIAKEEVIEMEADIEANLTHRSEILSERKV